MSDSVILFVANHAYFPHVKAAMVGCRRQGNWKGDFALICPTGSDASSLAGRGIDVTYAPESRWAHTVKFRVFSPSFRKWKRVLYLDCDILIQGDLNKLCDDLAKRFPKILCDGTQALRGSFGTTILQDWEHFDKLASGTTHPEVYQRIREKYPHIDQPIYVASAMCFDPSSIPEGTVEALFAVQEDFREANAGECDQEIINLLLYDRLDGMGKDYITWFAFDYPENRVPCPGRAWRGDEEPVILHYWGMYAPWIVKQEGAGGYPNHRLGRVCHELYAENLALFEETFPNV